MARTQEAVEEATEKANPDLFFDALADYTPAQWERDLMLYLYRLEPMRPNTDKNPYIKRYTQPVAIEDVKNTYGSGKYHLILNQRDEKNRKKNRTVLENVFEIEDPEYPPVMPGIDGWEKDPANKRWAGWKQKEEPVPATAQQGLTADDVLKIVDRVVERANPKNAEDKDALVGATIRALERGNESAIQMILNREKDNSPDKLIALLNAVNAGKKDGGDSTIITMLLQQQKQNHEMMLEMMRQQRNNGSSDSDPATKSITSRLLEKALDMLDGGAGVESRPQKWFQAVPWERAFEAFQGLVQTVQMGIAVKGAARPVGRGVAQPTDAPVNPQQPQALQPPAQGAAMPQSVAQLLDRFVSAFMNNMSPVDFADSAMQEYGVPQVKSIAIAGVDQIIGLIQQFPTVWQRLQPAEADVRKFLGTFCEYAMNPDDPKWDEEGEPEPPAPPERPTRRRGAAA